MDEYEKKLAEAIKAKKEAVKAKKETKAEEKAEKTTTEEVRKTDRKCVIGEIVRGRFGDIIKDVSCKIEGLKLTVTVTLNEKYENCFISTEPIVYETYLTPDEKELLSLPSVTGEIRRLVEEISELIEDKVIERFKPAFLSTFGLETLARKVGRERALRIFAYFAQKGSKFHGLALYDAVSHYIRVVAEEKDRGVANFIIKNIESAGFPLTAKVIYNVDPLRYTKEQRNMIVDALSSAVKRTIEKYCGTLPYTPRAEDARAVKDLVLAHCDAPDYVFVVKNFDESEVRKALKHIATIFPELGEFAEVEEREKPEIREKPEVLTKEEKDLIDEMRKRLKEKMRRWEG